MGSLNDAHQANGGVLLYGGELVLLYCEAVNCEVKGITNAKGRLYLTTHRIIFTSHPINPNSRLNSFSAPFFSMYDLALEQPIFGANSIKGKVRGQAEFAFEIKFNKGGAIEFGQAMRNAAKSAQTNAQQSASQQPPTYNTNIPNSSQYYQTPVDSVFQPNYPVGFVLPTQVFSQAPPPGFIYACDTPAPYPGIVPNVPAKNTPTGPTAPTAPTAPVATGGGPTNFEPAAYQSLYPSLSSQPTNGAYPTQPSPYPIQPSLYPQQSSPFQASQPLQANAAYPIQPGFNLGVNERPPTYDEATKKKQ